MNSVRSAALAALFLLTACMPTAHAEPTDTPLSALYSERVVKETQGWGSIGLDTATRPPNGRPGSPLRIGETVYEKGLGHHAPGEIVFEVPAGYSAFDALAGVHWQGGGRGSVIFQVFVDGEMQFDSGVMSDSDPAKAIHVPVQGGQELRLTAADAGDGIACDMANWAEACLVRDPTALYFGNPAISLSGQAAPAPSSLWCGFVLIAANTGPQVAALGSPATFLASLTRGEDVALTLPVHNLHAAFTLDADVSLLRGEHAEIDVCLDNQSVQCIDIRSKMLHLKTGLLTAPEHPLLQIRVRTRSAEAAVQCKNLTFSSEDRTCPLALLPNAPRMESFPPPLLPPLRPAIEEALIEWDWRMQDGIDTPREPRTYAAAVERTLERGDALIRDLQVSCVTLDSHGTQWNALRQESQALAPAIPADGPEWEALWRRVHRLRRAISLANPLADTGPLLFVKRVPSSFSHQLTQYYGRCARPGGGVFVLDAPGRSMQCRSLTAGQLPEGSYMHPEVTYDASRVLFAFCNAPTSPGPTHQNEDLSRRYHLYEIAPDGSRLRQLSDGTYDDFAPRELPNGQIVFISTRRGGYHRCGRGPCDVYTLALLEPDGTNPRTISYHETQEWDPAVLADGRVIYTRWDYVDRNAVHYQQLWAVHPDGTAPVAYYGNNTFNPVGVWEAQQVPGSDLVMATAAAHHAMTAGSIILVDVSKGVDGLEPLTRLTPDAPFPESETVVAPNGWHAPGSPQTYPEPPEARRWPGHCYRSPYPLSEKYFLAAYSFDPLIGEPGANPANMFGIYLVDRFGNKELLYRDLNIGSLWPTPLRPRPKPPVVAPYTVASDEKEGTFFLQDIHVSMPELPKGSVRRLRIVQVLPKSTPHANNPTVGLANASPGKQILGTVPVESDGSAYFRAPSGIPIAFQALDEHGQAIQIMRSLTYLQPGERAACVGCHEHRLTAPPQTPLAQALRREPSPITPAPDGANPLSYPLLVQPVLDKHCTKCHSGDTPAGPEGNPVVLTGDPEGRYTISYNKLAPKVPYSAWAGSNLDANGEPLTQPGRFGARASSLMKMLLEGHHQVHLDSNDIDRLTTWMDANALFYGTFDPEDQARQQRGERIQGPAIQ